MKGRAHGQAEARTSSRFSDQKIIDDPKAEAWNRMQPVYYVSPHDATSLRFKLYASTAFSSSSSLTQEL